MTAGHSRAAVGQHDDETGFTKMQNLVLLSLHGDCIHADLFPTKCSPIDTSLLSSTHSKLAKCETAVQNREIQT